MGLIFSRFKKKKTSFEILENLEEKIKALEEYGQSTEQQHKKIIGRLLVYSVGLYVLITVLFYLFYFPSNLKQQIIYIIPLLMFPVLLILVKRLVSWYYSKKVSGSKSKLFEMRQQKKKLLEEVMNKETYKVAKDILEKFAPETLPNKPTTALVPRLMPQTPVGTELRKRSIATVSQNAGAIVPSDTPRSSFYPPGTERPPLSTVVSSRVPLMQMPAPILPRDRTVMDRLVEYLIGDGPNNRYALICTKCQGHNGMVMKEEFEYTGFRCCYCFVLNPARKQRPDAPKLPTLGRFDAVPPDSDTEIESDSDGSGEKKEISSNEKVVTGETEEEIEPGSATEISSNKLEEINDLLPTDKDTEQESNVEVAEEENQVKSTQSDTPCEPSENNSEQTTHVSDIDESESVVTSGE